MQKLLLVYYHSENCARSQIWKYFQIWFSPDLGGKNGGVLSMRMQVILDSSFARPGSAPIWGGKKGEFRDWTKRTRESWHWLMLTLETKSPWKQTWNSVQVLQNSTQTAEKRNGRHTIRRVETLIGIIIYHFLFKLVLKSPDRECPVAYPFFFHIHTIESSRLTEHQL